MWETKLTFGQSKHGSAHKVVFVKNCTMFVQMLTWFATHIHWYVVKNSVFETLAYHSLKLARIKKVCS